jgi:hypothetical protein
MTDAAAARLASREPVPEVMRAAVRRTAAAAGATTA